MNQHQNILLTGGAGYIGSHTYIAMQAAGFNPVILDDFSNSHDGVLVRLAHITGRPVVCERGNVADTTLVEAVLTKHAIAAVVHFAGFKAVGESVAQPLKYYNNNVGGTLSLLQAMQATDCRTLVFSSSATVYGDPLSVPVTEDFPRQHTNPYAHTKLLTEDILASLRVSSSRWHTGVLRYFNPVGAHPSGLIGEDPSGIPNNLMPFVTQVAVGQRPFLSVFGNDYATPDGTGVRDYIHVQDLAQGHVAAVQSLLQEGSESFTLNLGTGQGHSVLEVVRAFEQASGRAVPFQFAPRRAGDVAQYYADPALAKQVLGWSARHTLNDMCTDAWRWQQGNPAGYATV